MNLYKLIVDKDTSKSDSQRYMFRLLKEVARVKLPAEIRYEFAEDFLKLYKELYGTNIGGKMAEMLSSYVLQDDTTSPAPSIHAGSPKLEYAFPSFKEVSTGGRWVTGVDGRKVLDKYMYIQTDISDMYTVIDDGKRPEELADIRVSVEQLDIPQRSKDWYMAHKFGGYSSPELSEIYGVTESYIRRIIRGVTAKLEI